jgi:flagellar motor protein MotB
MKRREPPQEEGAPAYMAQFTSLMTILLAFFIVMLTMGQEKASRYKMEGFGLIRDSSFGLKGGGLGFMSYMRAALQGHPDIARNGEESAEDRHLGYVRGEFDREQMDAEGIVHTEMQDWGNSVRIATPVVFKDDGWTPDPKSRQFLDRIGDVLYNLKGYRVTVSCYEAAGDDPPTARMTAARRALAVANYLERQKRVPRTMLHAVGYSDARYMEFADGESPTQKTVFFVRKTPLVDDRRLEF